MHNLPSGMLTFLFTDIEGSTVLWEQDPEQARTAMKDHLVIGQGKWVSMREKGLGWQ